MFVFICFYLFVFVFICFKMFFFAFICFYLFLCVLICFHLFLFVFICFYLFLCVFICSYLFLSDFMCFYMFSFVFKCFYLLLSVLATSLYLHLPPCLPVLLAPLRPFWKPGLRNREAQDHLCVSTCVSLFVFVFYLFSSVFILLVSLAESTPL